MTALIVAVKGGYTQSVREILKRSPNVNLTDKDGNTALMIASKEGHTDIVQDLLDAGTYVNIPDRVGHHFRICLPVVTPMGGDLTSHHLLGFFIHDTHLKVLLSLPVELISKKTRPSL